MKSIENLDLRGKRVFIRADMNVPLDEHGQITDDHRIKASLPTINFAREAGAAVVLCSHVGQPKGKRVEGLSLKPVATRLAELIDTKVVMADDCVGEQVVAQSNELQAGEVLLLENPRFHPGEKANDPEFVAQLAALADVYVNDAFASNHRTHASTVGLAGCYSEKAAGFTLCKEMEFFERAFNKPQHPMVAIFGGAKVSTKMRAIRNVAEQADIILVGGAMANTFFAATGKEIGKSLFEPEQVEAARETVELLASRSCRLMLPVDVVVAAEFKEGLATESVSADDIPVSQMALDIGPETLAEYRAACSEAKTIIWNGPMGAFEIPEFSAGTYGMIDILAESSALTVVGGGDTDLALHQKGAMDKMGYVSTGGGAFLHLLEGKELPGVTALD